MYSMCGAYNSLVGPCFVFLAAYIFAIDATTEASFGLETNIGGPTTLGGVDGDCVIYQYFEVLDTTFANCNF